MCSVVRPVAYDAYSCLPEGISFLVAMAKHLEKRTLVGEWLILACSSGGHSLSQ